jgi:elongation factor Ts
MSEISASLVRDLRAKTGAGMMDCKQALAQSAGDVEAAVDWLRTKGLARAAKKAGRVAADGLIGLALASGAGGMGVGAVVEVNSETDFVARNDRFQELVRAVAETALKVEPTVEAIGAAKLANGVSVKDEIVAAVATIGENISLRRAGVLKVSPGVVAGYMHSQLSPGLGKLGVLVALKSTGDAAALQAFGRQLAMHVAAANPQSVTVADLDPALIERERQILAEQAKASGKPSEIIDKMVEGRLRKFYQEVVLTEQTFVIDGETPVSKVLAQAAKTAGAAIEIAGFIRFHLGEGIAKPETDLASEVASMAS